MALHTLGSATTTTLNCIPGWSAAIAAADLSAIGGSVVNDAELAAILGNFPGGQNCVLATGTTHSNTTLDTLVARAGSPALAAVKAGDLVLGAGIVPGTYVAAKPTSTSVTLSQAATASASGVAILFSHLGNWPGIGIDRGATQLVVPNRGTLNILPGDVVAIDNTGWPILVSGATIAYAGSQWTFT